MLSASLGVTHGNKNNPERAEKEKNTNATAWRALSQFRERLFGFKSCRSTEQTPLLIVALRAAIAAQYRRTDWQGWLEPKTQENRTKKEQKGQK